MGYRRTPFAIGEWYHCFSRGIDKRVTFENEDDCRRFIQLLYLANDIKPVNRGNFWHIKHGDILQLERESTIVSIGAYCLMGNHYHIVIQEIIDNGISRFMQKLGTGYTMYFNEKNHRVGSLFVGPFRSRHIDTDAYIRRVTQYVHLNPAERIERLWKKGQIKDVGNLEMKLKDYPFSSMPEYYGTDIPRIENAILNPEAFSLLRDRLPPLKSVLRDAAAYYADLETEF